MKNLLFIHFGLALVILFISGSGLFIPAGIAIALIVAQRLAVKFDLITGDLPAWYEILASCYAANFLTMLIGWIL